MDDHFFVRKGSQQGGGLNTNQFFNEQFYSIKNDVSFGSLFDFVSGKYILQMDKK